jgi:hypothetical protein
MRLMEGKRLRRLALGLVLLFEAAMIVAPRPWIEALRATGEGVLMLLWIWWLLLCPPVRGLVARLPAAHLRILAGAPLLALLVGQLLDRSNAAFPLVSWRMFAVLQPFEPFEYLEYEGRTADGRGVGISPSALYPSLTNYRLRVGLEDRIGQAFDANNPARGADQRILADTLTAIGGAYNRAHPEAPLRDLGIYRRRINPRRGQPAQPAERTRLLEVKLP